MPDWPNSKHDEFEPPFLTNVPNWYEFSGLAPLHTSAVWHNANSTIYTPVLVQRKRTVKRLYAFNGAAVSGNCSIALYSSSAQYDGSPPERYGYVALQLPYTRLTASGSVAQAGTNVWQAFDVADVVLAPGLYWLAYALDNTTGAVMRLASVAVPGPGGLGPGRFAHFRAENNFPPPNPALPGVLFSDYTYSIPLLAMGGLA